MECANYRSCGEFKEEVEAQILEEIAEGRYLVTQEKPTIVSALGALPKPDGGIRLIHDASRPCGQAVNDYASLESRIAFQSVRDATELLTESSFMAKIDLKSAYRSVSTNSQHHHLAGLQWKFKGHTEFTFLKDTRLPFGARLSVQAFHRLSKAIQRFMAKRGIKTIVYLDDFLVVGNDREECLQAMNTLIKLLRDLGFYIAYSKLEGPTQRLTFLGIEIDVRAGVLRLPQKKLSELHSLLSTFLLRTRASLRQLQHLAGRLVFASNIIKGGRSFLHYVFEQIRMLKQAHHKALLSDKLKSELRWWLHSLVMLNASIFVKLHRPTVTITTDACNFGAGMIFKSPFYTDWAYINWEFDYPTARHSHINVKETLAAILAIYRWAPQLRHCRVRLETDNITTRANISKGACRHSEFLMYHLKNLFWICTLYDIHIDCVYLPGALNIDSDAISRLHQPGHLLYWASRIHPTAPFTPPLFSIKSATHMSLNSLLFILSQVHHHECFKTWTRQQLSSEARHLP